MKKLPKILYDQTQYTPIFFLDSGGFWLSDAIHKGGEDISGYASDGWYLYTQNKPESFFFGAYDEKALEAEAENGLKNFSDDKFLSSFEGAVEESYQKTLKLKNRYFEDFYNKEAESVAEDKEKVVSFLEDARESLTYILSYYLLTQPQRFYGFESELQKEVLDADTEFVSTNGHKLTYVSELRKAILDYTQKVIDSELSYGDYKAANETDYQDLLSFVTRLGFLNWGLLGGSLIDEAHVDGEIAGLLDDKEKFNEEKKGVDEVSSNVDKRKELLNANDSKARKLADVMGKSSVIRFDLQTCALCIMKYVDNLIKATAKHNNLGEDEINSYTSGEVMQLIAHGSVVDPAVTARRQGGYLRIYRNNSTQTYTGDEAKTELADLLTFRQEEIEQAKQLRGTVASYPDKVVREVEGRVFVLTTAFDVEDKIKTFSKGDILVATQTHPNLVPIMKEALAIVTDEGGITCHAAIVSRELKKPCIIGTRLASKALKTGDKIIMHLTTGDIEKVS